jgi:hypothetical protein
MVQNDSTPIYLMDDPKYYKFWSSLATTFAQLNNFMLTFYINLNLNYNYLIVSS